MLAEVAVSEAVSPDRLLQLPQVGLVAQVRTAVSPSVAVQARYWTS